MYKNLSAVILAGGFGTRVKNQLRDVPKPMAPVAGRPFLEWVIRYLRNQGIAQFVLSTGYRAEVIEDYFKVHQIPDTEIVCVPENRPLGTAGGFLNAVAKSGLNSSQWLVANGDSLALAKLNDFFTIINNELISAAILALSVEDSTRYGTLEVTASGRLMEFTEKRQGLGLINAGLYLFKSEALKLFPAVRPLSFETEVFPHLLFKSVPIAVNSVSAPFLDIGTPQSLVQADGFIESNRDYFL